MNVSFGSPELISQAFYPIFAISLVLSVVICTLVAKVFDLNKGLALVAGILMLTASITFSSFNLSTMFYQLTLHDKTLVLYFAFPFINSQSVPIEHIRYADAITPDANVNQCHVVLEDTQGVIYQSLDIGVNDCQRIRQQLADTLHLANRPPPKRSRHKPPLPQQ